jgi:hypothetical protein
MAGWNTIRNRISSLRRAGETNNTDNANIEHGGQGLGLRNNPPRRFQDFIRTIGIRRPQNRPGQRPTDRNPAPQNPPQVVTALNVTLPDIAFNFDKEVDRRLASTATGSTTTIFAVLPKVEDIEKKTKRLEGVRQTTKVPVYRPATLQTSSAGSSKEVLPDKPLGHLPQRSYRQVMVILGQSDSASALDIPALITCLDKEIGELEAYEAQAKQALDENKQPRKEISRSDAKFARHIVAMYNADDPNLNAEVFNSPPELIRYIKENAEDFSRLRALFRMGSTSDVLHHSAADIRVKHGKPTILCADPSNFAQQNIVRSVIAMNDALEDLPEENRACGYVGVGAQNSPGDCVPFAASFLKKMVDEEEFMNGMHDKLNNGQPLDDEPHIRPRSEERAIAMEIAEEMIKDELNNISQSVPDARHFFPLSFYKHAHSPKDIEELLERQPDKSAAKVNKAHPDRPAQTLAERVAGHIPKEGRTHNDKTVKYSISIEKKRLEEISETIEFFKGLKKTLVSTE